ncbi:unnamed protein product, partial [Coregonus sp. 'balchen']
MAAGSHVSLEGWEHLPNLVLSLFLQLTLDKTLTGNMSFGVPFATANCSITAKSAFCLIFMWRTLFRNLHCNRRSCLQRFPPHKYWTQWLVLEENVPLPSVRLPCADIESLWGIEKDVLAGPVQDHCELETRFSQYTQYRFLWLFTYWLFCQPDGSTVRGRWHPGEAHCVTSATWPRSTTDYWKGKLARGDGTVYEDTLQGVYLLQETLVEHKWFWQVAKVQIARVQYIVSGNAVYLGRMQGFLQRKRLVHHWIFLEQNSWVRRVLPDNLYPLLEFDTKISQ